MNNNKKTLQSGDRAGHIGSEDQMNNSNSLKK